ncbi:MAG: hypothetical protein ACYCSI_02820 [Solirubrobacteraceae bacterium]
MIAQRARLRAPDVGEPPQISGCYGRERHAAFASLLTETLMLGCLRCVRAHECSGCDVSTRLVVVAGRDAAASG